MSNGDISRKRIRLVDIARAVGVSRGAVGHVLLGSGGNIGVSPETASKIRQAAKKLNYQPNQVAQRLSGKSTHLIGALLTQSAMSAKRAERLLAFEAVARQAGYRVLVSQLHLRIEDLQTSLDEFAARGIDTIAYLDTDNSVGELLAEIPCLVSCVRFPSSAICYVQMDRFAAAKMAVDHLIERGRRRIGLVEMARMGGHSMLEDDKHDGYCQAIRQHGLEDGLDRIAVFPTTSGRPAVMEVAGGIIAELVAKKCDALVFTADRWAAVGMKELKRLGLKVPQDVAVVGFDNREYSDLLDPELTTIDHRHTRCAELMMEQIARLEKHEPLADPQRCILVQPQLIVRQST